MTWVATNGSLHVIGMGCYVTRAEVSTSVSSEHGHQRPQNVQPCTCRHTGYVLDRHAVPHPPLSSSHMSPVQAGGDSCHLQGQAVHTSLTHFHLVNY